MIKINDPALFLKKNSFELEAYCPQPSYRYLALDTTLTYEEALLLVATLAVSNNSISSLRFDVSRVLFSDADPALFLTEFDMNQILLTLEKNGFLALKGSRVIVTEMAKRVVLERSGPATVEWFAQKREELLMIKNAAIKNHKHK